MVGTISLEKYKELDLYWVSKTSEQWLNNGIDIVFELECDNDYYYLTVYIPQYIYDWYEEHPEYDRDILEETEKFCKEFACKKCINLDDVNYYIRGELPDNCLFEEDDEGNVYGN